MYVHASCRHLQGRRTHIAVQYETICRLKKDAGEEWAFFLLHGSFGVSVVATCPEATAQAKTMKIDRFFDLGTRS